MPQMPGLVVQVLSHAILLLPLLSFTGLAAQYRPAPLIERCTLYFRLRHPELIHNLHNNYLKEACHE
jgi:hypothetical protein